MTREELLGWLREPDEARLEVLFAQADAVRREVVGEEVHLRGLLEWSNRCERSCAYCGMNVRNHALRRYELVGEEVRAIAAEAVRRRLPTLLLQAGESRELGVAEVVETIRAVKREGMQAVALSLGERPFSDYAAFRAAGADRYLLKFETSHGPLYERLHPPRRSGNPDRFAHLAVLRDLGYEIGSGIMVGLPGQRREVVADDLERFAELDLDMVAVGPYIPHPDAPLGRHPPPAPDNAMPAGVLASRVVLALTRLVCPEANIPATTALATAAPEGYEAGLRSGANVIMVNLTPPPLRALYVPYPRTPGGPDDPQPGILALLERVGRPAATTRGDRVVGAARGVRSE